MGSGSHKPHEAIEIAPSSALPYETAGALRDAITAKIKQRAAGDATLAMQIRRLVAIERFIARLFLTQPGWVLKGALALRARLPEARYTHDIDLYQGETDTSLEAKLDKAATTDLGDFLQFSVSPVGTITGTPGERFSVVAFLDDKELATFGVDVVTQSTMTTKPDNGPVASPIPIEEFTATTVTMFPLSDHVANKLSGILIPPAPKTVSSRYRDLVDLALISQSQPLQADTLRASLSQGFADGLPSIDDLKLPDEALWEAGYASVLEENRHLDVPSTATEALALVKTLLEPILTDQDVHTWDPDAATWN